MTALLCAWPAAAERAPDLTLTGAMTGADHQTYREVPFRVPAGVTRITVEFAYTGKEQRSVIDLGLRDPQRFRGWSGGNKSRFSVSDADATPSYLPGPLPSGQWKLVLGVPNMRKDGRADYTARIWLERGAPDAAAPVKSGAGWYRGDLHMHTGHSDGSCASRTGKRVPCPVFKTLEAATARGLDFISITEHNATSHAASIRELAPYFDDLLVIPGREITTFHGHANVFGPTGPIDFQLGSARAPALAAIQGQVERAGGLFSINHPGLPSGEACMGCGWTVKETDYARVQAIEVINGGSLGQAGGSDRPFSGVPFWEARLKEGFRITAIGGSDNHDPTLDPAKAPAIGVPTTVVRADELSQAAILAGVRAGRVFLDLTGSRDKLLEMTGEAAGKHVEMGGVLALEAGEGGVITVRIRGAAGGKLTLLQDSTPVLSEEIGADHTATFNLGLAGGARYLRAEVRGPDGKLWLLGNPIYFQAPGGGPSPR